MHGEFNLTEIAIVALVALSCGVILERFRQPAVLGYILAGVLLGPSLFGFVESRELVSILAEIGVLLLLFLIGLELDLEAFKKVWHIALGCTFLQILGSLIVVFIIGKVFGLSTGLTIVLACAIALSSTAVAFKMMESIGELNTPTGRITVGVLIAQDLAIVPMILIIRGLGGDGLGWLILFKLLIAVGVLAVLILALGKRQKLELPFHNTLTAQHDLIPLLCLGFCFGLAAIAGLVGLSAAYGAFLAGLILGNTTAHKKLMKATHPIQSIFIMVFFLSVGLLMDLQFMWAHLWTVLVLLLVITVGKSFLNITILNILGKPWPQAFLAGLLLAQMGEFAFLLTTVGQEAGLVDTFGNKLIISLAALSLTLSPFWLMWARRLHDFGPTKNIQSLGQLFDKVFGKETHLVATAYKHAKQVSEKSVETAKETIHTSQEKDK